MCARNSHGYTHLIIVSGYRLKAYIVGFLKSNHIHGRTVSLSTFQPIRDPSTSWQCHSAGASGPASTRISARMKSLLEHSSPLNTLIHTYPYTHDTGGAPPGGEPARAPERRRAAPERLGARGDEADSARRGVSEIYSITGLHITVLAVNCSPPREDGIVGRK